jgi:hypothetical protein
LVTLQNVQNPMQNNEMAFKAQGHKVRVYKHTDSKLNQHLNSKDLIVTLANELFCSQARSLFGANINTLGILVAGIKHKSILFYRSGHTNSHP